MQISLEFSWADLLPLAAGEGERLQRRLARLRKLEAEAGKAALAFQQIRTPEQLTVRPQFAVRFEPADVPGDPSDRLLPPRHERPPATRLISPRGIALRLYLTALFESQTRSAGERPGNTLPLADRDRVSWIDFLATPAERGGVRTFASVRDKKIRQLQDALRRLSGPDIQLVTLPHWTRATGKYEDFLLMHEGGAPYGGGTNDRYTVPTGGVERLVRLPAGLFHNGWIHVLEDTELAFLLMIACLHAHFGNNQPVFATGQVRLLQFGLGRDAYQAHQILGLLHLIEVEVDPDRHIGGGKIRGFSEDNPPKLHRFRLLRDGFDQPAIPTTRSAIERRLG